MTKAYKLIKKNDPAYPEKFKNHGGMPNSFYLKGSLPDPYKKAVAIVGSRRCSTYGEYLAAHFARELSRYGVQIISGLALGIDSFAHRGCLEGGEKTFAVMGCGIEHVYPSSNTLLYKEILQKGGGIISEFEPGAPPTPFHFPIRNRLISALSDAIIIIEAQRKSGSLITASYALDQGIQIYAVPGRIGDKRSEGTNDLILQGAAPALSPEQIIADLKLMPEKVRPNKKASAKMKTKKEEPRSSDKSPQYSDDEQRIIQILSYEPLTLDDICRLSNMDATLAARLLMTLEINGSIASPIPGSYVISHR